MNKENNNLIAEFMGAVCKMVDHTEGNEDYCRQEGLDKWIIPTWTKPDGYDDEWGWGKYSLGFWEYDKKWDWLMPVICKIKTEILKRPKRIDEALITGKIENIYNATVEFIKWHNIRDLDEE